MPPPTPTPEVLIVAENASSKFGGESFLPLKYFQLLKRRGYAAKLVTHARNKSDLDVFLEEYREDITYAPDTKWHRIVWRLCNVFPTKIREVLSELLLKGVGSHTLSKLVQDLILSGGINLIHQPTPVSPRSPSAMHRFGLPLVIGPMNGGMSYPQDYKDYESFFTRNFVTIARQTAVWVNLIIPGKRRAKILLVANARTRSALPLTNHPNVIEIVENGVDLTTWQQPPLKRELRSVSVPFRLVYMGRLISWKALDFTIRAIGLARDAGADVRFDILGDGPERTRLELLSTTLGLDDVITFHGFLSQVQCARILSESDALILNSLYECGGAVVLEAMSMGLPVIASDWGGPADYLDEGCGILVPPNPREDFEERLGAAIMQLVKDPALCHRMGQAGLTKIQNEFDWEKKIDQILEIYNLALKAQ